MYFADDLLEYLGKFASDMSIESLMLFLARNMEDDVFTLADFTVVFTPQGARFEKELDQLKALDRHIGGQREPLSNETIDVLEAAWVSQLNLEEVTKKTSHEAKMSGASRSEIKAYIKARLDHEEADVVYSMLQVR